MVGGAETYALGLLSAYRSGHGPDHTTVLANAVGMRAYADIAENGVNLEFVPGLDPHGSTAKRAWQLGRAALWPRTLRRRISTSIDLMHYPVVVPLPRTRLPSVISLHDVRHLAMPEQFSRAERAYRRIAYDEAARRAALVLTGSEHARAAIIEMLKLDDERVIAIHQGLDHSRFQPNAGADDDTVIADLQLDKPFVIYPANLWPHKNHQALLGAMVRLRDMDLTLVLTGETYDALPELQETVQRLGLSGTVRHLGYVPASVVPVLYRHAAALVYPSLYEGFGAPPLEAMACGCPCVVSGSGSIAEVTQGVAEMVDPYDEVSIADGIRRVLDDGEKRADLVRRGQAHSQQFTWTSTAQRHVAAYRRVLAA
jgi:glycosyltransferase involved in cell wall biosynthesis